MASFMVLRTFSGRLAGVKGQTLEITDEQQAKDLLLAGYITPAGREKDERRRAKTSEDE